MVWKTFSIKDNSYSQVVGQIVKQATFICLFFIYGIKMEQTPDAKVRSEYLSQQVLCPAV